jgi:hypothetical protein
MGDVPRIELFARERADDRDAMGNEIDGHDMPLRNSIFARTGALTSIQDGKPQHFIYFNYSHIITELQFFKRFL